MRQEEEAPLDGEILPHEGVTTPLPRVKAAGRLREQATHEAILKSAAQEEAEPEVAAESLKELAKPRCRGG